MKPVCCLLLLFVVSSAKAQLENTRWKTTLELSGGPTSVLIDFRKDTALVYTTGDSTMIERMTYTKDNSSFTLVKIDGQSGCGNEPGKYGYTIKDGRLALSLLQDNCYDRYSAIQNTEWIKQ